MTNLTQPDPKEAERLISWWPAYVEVSDRLLAKQNPRNLLLPKPMALANWPTAPYRALVAISDKTGIALEHILYPEKRPEYAARRAAVRAIRRLGRPYSTGYLAKLFGIQPNSITRMGWEE